LISDNLARGSVVGGAVGKIIGVKVCMGKLTVVGIELASCVGALIVIVQEELMRRIIAKKDTLARLKLGNAIKGLLIKLATTFLTNYNSLND